MVVGGTKTVGAIGAGDGDDEELLGFETAVATPLFQTNFLPFFMHVYLIPADVEICPTFLQAEPGFIAADATEMLRDSAKHAVAKIVSSRFIHLRVATRQHKKSAQLSLN